MGGGFLAPQMLYKLAEGHGPDPSHSLMNPVRMGVPQAACSRNGPGDVSVFNSSLANRGNEMLKRFLAIGLLPLLVTASSACGDTPPNEPPVPATEPAAALGERVDWTPCGPDIECGFVEAPADYRDPEAGSIMIAVNVHRATSLDERIGYLFVNPGGPGESGVELVHSVPFGVFADEVVARFDIVGFDPRGVGMSEPEFACGDSGEQLDLLAAIDGAVDTPDETAAGEAAANLCIESMGPVGGLLHSAYVARDMDEIRAALGADRISYLGFSYGSTLGAWYATLFPDSIRAMVVDGADNPVRPVATQEERINDDVEFMETFSLFLEGALRACADPDCPIYYDGDPVGYYYRAVEKLDLVNAAANNHPQAGALGVISTLYSEETWPGLWQGLFELNENDDPSILLEFASLQLGPDPGAASFTAHVNCLDDWALYPELDRATRLADSVILDGIMRQSLPLLAAAMNTFELDPCPFYERFAPEPLTGPLDGSGVSILVVGNRNDPFTSFRESEELATETLSNGYLLETSHPTHVVYPNNECVNDHVHRALIDGQYPSERRVSC
jgi:pimeloyl-ACP methyl ester carboxylesterase